MLNVEWVWMFESHRACPDTNREPECNTYYSVLFTEYWILVEVRNVKLLMLNVEWSWMFEGQRACPDKVVIWDSGWNK
jgi:hypothetical protein